MTIKYLKKSPKTSSTDDTKTREIVENILKDIYYGMMQFMVLQIIGLILIVVFPQIALWLPTLLYGS